MNEKIYKYYVHTIAGLEEVVMEDVRQELGEVESLRLERGERQGRVFFAYRRSPRRLGGLRSAISAYGLLADVRGVTVGQPGLQRVCQALERIPLEAARSLVRSCDPDVDVNAFRVSATVRGSHRFDGRELTAAAAGVLTGAHHLQPAGQGGAMHLQIQVSGKRAVIGIQVGARREPGSPRRDGVGGPLAYCLVRMMGVEAGDRVVVAGCSPAGTLEIANSTGAGVCGLNWRKSKIGRLGEGRDPAPGSRLELVAHSSHLPLGGGLADAAVAVVADGPRDRSASAFEIVPELARALGEGGVMAVLAGDPRTFIPRLKGASLPLEILTGLPIGVGGRLYGLYLLERSGLELLQL